MTKKKSSTNPQEEHEKLVDVMFAIMERGRCIFSSRSYENGRN